MIQITDISGSTELRNRFIDFGVDFPKQFKNNIPKFRQSEANLLDEKKNFFFKQGGIFKGYIVTQNNKVIGRVAAMINPTIVFDEGKLGLIGMFECINDSEVSKLLLNTAKNWLVQQKCNVIWGPFDFSMWHNYRFLTDGFDDKPYIGEPRNPDYYPKLFTDFGFAPKYEWQNRILDITGIKYVMERFKEQYDIFNQLGYKFVKINKNNEKELMAIGYELFIDTYKVFTGFSCISKIDFLEFYDYVPLLLDRDASFFIENPEGEYIAFLLVVKDLADSLQAMNGKTNLLAKLRFKLNENRSEYANLYQGGAQMHAIREAMKIGKAKIGKPLALGRASMYKSMEAILISGKYKYAIFPLMREDAPNRNYSEGAYVKIRSHWLYEMKLK